MPPCDMHKVHGRQFMYLKLCEQCKDRYGVLVSQPWSQATGMWEGCDDCHNRTSMVLWNTWARVFVTVSMMDRHAHQ